MNITTNHVALLLRAKRGITINEALRLDQRTLGSACSKTTTRPRMIDFNGEFFMLTDFGYSIVMNTASRKARSYTELSAGVKKFTRQAPHVMRKRA